MKYCVQFWSPFVRLDIVSCRHCNIDFLDCGIVNSRKNEDLAIVIHIEDNDRLPH